MIKSCRLEHSPVLSPRTAFMWSLCIRCSALKNGFINLNRKDYHDMSSESLKHCYDSAESLTVKLFLQNNINLPIDVWRIVHACSFKHHQWPIEDRGCSIRRPEVYIIRNVIQKNKSVTHTNDVNWKSNTTQLPFVVYETIIYHFANVAVQSF